MWLLFSLTWGTIRLFRERHETKENGWGFGQLVPVLLLLLPALLMLEGFSGMETQADMQLMALRATDGDSSMALDSVPLTGHPSDTLCPRVQLLCNQDYRGEPWYLDNLFLIMSYFTSAACIILQMPLLGNGQISILTSEVPGVFIAGFFVPGIIPLCGIVSGIQGREWCTPFLIKLAVNSGKRYRVSRWIFCLWAPVSAIIFVIGWHYWDSVDGFDDPSMLSWISIGVVLWILVCVIISCYALFRGLFSIYSQVLVSRRTRDYI